MQGLHGGWLSWYPRDPGDRRGTLSFGLGQGLRLNDADPLGHFSGPYARSCLLWWKKLSSEVAKPFFVRNVSPIDEMIDIMYRPDSPSFIDWVFGCLWMSLVTIDCSYYFAHLVWFACSVRWYARQKLLGGREVDYMWLEIDL